MVELGKALLKSAEDGDTNEVKNLIGRGAPMTADWLGKGLFKNYIGNISAFFGHICTLQIFFEACLRFL